MISEVDKAAILEYAKKYDLTEVILFGSSVEKEDANDIDIGIKGIEPRLFFKLYGELFMSLSKPVDLIELSKKTLFNQLVERNGEKIYG